MSSELWASCLHSLQEEFSAQQYNTWIKPLKVSPDSTEKLILVAPNRFVRDWVNDKFLSRIRQVVCNVTGDISTEVQLEVANNRGAAPKPRAFQTAQPTAPAQPAFTPEAQPFTQPEQPSTRQSTSINDHLTPQVLENSSAKIIMPASFPETAQTSAIPPSPSSSIDSFSVPSAHNGAIMEPPERTVNVEGGLKHHQSNLNHSFTFESFVQGKSNQLALAAARQVGDNPGVSYNPLFIYGGVGLGKTHLMHAVGNEMLKRNPNAKIVYLHSERFVADMVKALQLNAINDF